MAPSTNDSAACSTCGPLACIALRRLEALPFLRFGAFGRNGGVTKKKEAEADAPPLIRDFE